MDAAIWGFIGTIIGALASIGTTWLSSTHASRLQRQTALEGRTESSRAFQRDTLLQLQEALHDALRMVTRAHIEDTAAFKQSGSWGRSYLSAEVDEGVLLTRRKVSILIQRVVDNELRERFKTLSDVMSRAVMARSQGDADAAIVRLCHEGDSTMEQIGTVLRGVY